MHKVKSSFSTIIFCLLMVFPLEAFCHSSQSGGGFLSGLSHPVLGIDHLLAMLSVGILSAQIGGKAIWTVPATFVIVMTLGGFIGIGSIALWFIEPSIALSVLVLGLAIAFDRKMPVVVIMLFVAFFAFAHGYAHGMEMPAVADPFIFSAGFVLGTTLIHLAGLGIGAIAGKNKVGIKALRLAGGIIAAMGVYLLIA
jgi:urease accessory protein